jgi:hypothetical protein
MDYDEVLQSLDIVADDPTLGVNHDDICANGALAIRQLQARVAELEEIVGAPDNYITISASVNKARLDEIVRLSDDLAAARALLRRLAMSGVTANPGVLHHYRCAVCGGSWSGRPTGPEQHEDGCLAALVVKDET